MIAKAEQDRIRALLRDTITLLCKNGLTFKAEFSIEALIGITLDHDDVVLVSINEQIKPDKLHRPHSRSTDDDDSADWSKPLEIAPYEDFSSHNRSGGDRNHHRRRRRKRPYIKVEDISENEQQEGDLDLSGEGLEGPEEAQPPVKRSNSQEADSSEDIDTKESVIVKREAADDNWPPAGVVQEVTIGGSDSGNSDQPLYPGMYASSSFFPSGMLPNMSGMNPSMDSPGSSPKHRHPLPHLSIMNGLPFPPLQLPQSHFAQALGRLVGSVPPSLVQNMHRSVAGSAAPKSSSTPSKASSSHASSSLYQPTSRSSLPKEAVALMTEWLRKNMHNPYPTDDIKDDFVQKTGLTFNQINYWFTNARRRLLPKWEVQRTVREQEMVQHLGHVPMGGTPPSSSPRSSHSAQGLGHAVMATISSSSRGGTREMSTTHNHGETTTTTAGAKGEWS